MKHFYELTKEQKKLALTHIENEVEKLLGDRNLFPDGFTAPVKKIAHMAAEGSTYTDEGVLEMCPQLN